VNIKRQAVGSRQHAVVLAGVLSYRQLPIADRLKLLTAYRPNMSPNVSGKSLCGRRRTR